MSEAQQTSLLCLETTCRRDVEACAAKLKVTVEGDKLFSGKEALRHAKSVRKLLDDLESEGLGNEAVAVEDIHAQSKSGLLGTSSSATYKLSIQCDDLDKLPTVLEVVTRMKTVELSTIEWDYGDMEAHRFALFKQGAVLLTEQARETAAALGTSVVAVHRLGRPREKAVPTPGAVAAFAPESLGQAPRRSRSVAEALDFGLVNRQTVTVTVHGEFTLAPL